MRKIQIQLYENGLDKVRRLERALRAVTEEGVPVTTACARENLQYEWFRRFASQNIDADRDDQKAAVTVTWDDWSTWQERFLRDMIGEITPVPEGYRRASMKSTIRSRRKICQRKHQKQFD